MVNSKRSTHFWLVVSAAVVVAIIVGALATRSSGPSLPRTGSTLANLPSGPAARELAGSPPRLAAIHRQSDQLLGGEPALAARIRALRGYPVVVNVWGSWCGPCRAEFGLLANASARYGRQVAFLGADVSDSSGDAHAFLAQHPVSYPSYQMNPSDLTAIVPQGIAGTPSTVFFSRAGRVVHVQIGQYESQGLLNSDVQTYALSG